MDLVTSHRRRAVGAVTLVALVALVAACGGAGSGPSDEGSRCEPENLVWVYSRITEPDDHAYPSTVFRFERGEETALTSGDARSPALSPDGRRVVFQRGSGGEPESAGYARFDLYVMDSDGGGEEPLLVDDPEAEATTAWDTKPVWSPDGTRIAFVRNRDLAPGGDSPGDVHRVMVASVADRTARPLPGGVADLHDSAPAWSSDGTRLAWIVGGATLHWSSLDGRDRHERPLAGTPYGPPAWIDGDRAILVRLDDGTSRVDATTGEITELDLGVAPRALWSLPTGELAGLDGSEASSPLVVVDPGEPGDVEEITTLAGSRILPEGSVGARARGPVTAAPAAPGGWAACP
jgi:dipeptidyl aminopeptidase/acylaminoacyl peptidase